MSAYSQGSGVSSAFSYLGGSPSAQKCLDNPDGYAYYLNSVYKSPYTNASDLYLLREQIWFTPGYAARNDGTNPNRDYYNSGAMLGKGTVGVTLKKYESGDAHGGDVAIKSFWPQSSNVSTTVTSSFGTTLSGSLGFSQSAGAEIGDGAKITVSKGQSSGVGLSFTWSKSTSSLVEDPMVSSQYSPSTNLGVTWNYEVNGKDTAGKLTYAFDCFVLFEMSRSYANCGSSAFQFVFSLATQDAYWDWTWYLGHDWFYGTTYDYNLHVDAFTAK